MLPRASPLFRPTNPRSAADGVAEAVRHARAAAGRGAVLRVLEVDPGADVPERWATLTPFPEDAAAQKRAAR